MEGNRFCENLAALRHRKGVSQRKAAADMLISQALLSHYENGAREPGLPFLCRACDYYGVSADFLLGRTDELDPLAVRAERLSGLAAELRTLAEKMERCI